MYTVPKCWEITAANMQAGQRVKTYCPAYLSYGGTPKYGHFGNDLIPADSPLVFELDILECENTIDKINAANKKAGNKAPVIYKRGEKRPKVEPAVPKSEIKQIKNKVFKMKKEVNK